MRVKLRASPSEGAKEDGLGLLGIDGLCAYEWRVAVGEATLSLAELRELAALKLPLVKARGRWVALRPEDVEAALAFFEGRAERGEMPVGELLLADRAAAAPAAGLAHAEIETRRPATATPRASTAAATTAATATWAARTPGSARSPRRCRASSRR